MLTIVYLEPHGKDLVGFIPDFINPDDPRTAAQQFDQNYSHGGGWRPMKGWTLRDNNSIKYPGDPAEKPVAVINFRDETIFVYHHAWVAIVQADRSFEVSRMD